jgi:methionine-rich copper-binding protein CopC
MRIQMVGRLSLVSRLLLALVLGGAIVATNGAVAFGHGILESASPEPDSRVAEPPERASTTLTEAPVPDGRYIVRDGCDQVVSSAFDVDDRTISADLNEGQPGTWRVRFDFISSVDGHRYNRMYSFKVDGKSDCAEPEETDKGGDEKDTGMTPDRGSHQDDSNMASGASQGNSRPPIPLVPLAVTSVAALGLAVLGRRPASSD